MVFNARPLLDAEALVQKGDLARASDKLWEAVSQSLKAATGEWTAEGPRDMRRLLDRRAIAEAFPGALVVSVQVDAADDEGAAQLAAQPVASLADEWDRYLASVPIEGYDRDRLAALGRQQLQRAEEEAG